MTNLCVVLENTDTGETLDLKFRVLENSTAKKWANQLCSDLKTRGHDDGVFRFFNAGLSLDDVAKNLNDIIYIINDEDEKAKLQNVLAKTLDQTKLNLLHDYFVKTRDSAGYDRLSDKLKKAIDDLNTLIHYCEGLTSKISPRIVCTCEGRSILPLADDDYTNFTMYGNVGDVFITYCVVGKTYIDIFRGDDSVCNEDEIRPQRVYSSSFIIRFTDNPLTPDVEAFNAWMINRGHDLNDKKLALGKIKVATPVEPIDDSMISIIEQYQLVKEIRVED